MLLGRVIPSSYIPAATWILENMNGVALIFVCQDLGDKFRIIKIVHLDTMGDCLSRARSFFGNAALKARTGFEVRPLLCIGSMIGAPFVNSGYSQRLLNGFFQFRVDFLH
jgi:hypothetical protein